MFIVIYFMKCWKYGLFTFFLYFLYTERFFWYTFQYSLTVLEFLQFSWFIILFATLYIFSRFDFPSPFFLRGLTLTVWFVGIEWCTTSWNISRPTLAGFLRRPACVRDVYVHVRQYPHISTGGLVVKPAVLVTPCDVKNVRLLLFHTFRSFRAPRRPRATILYIVTAGSPQTFCVGDKVVKLRRDEGKLRATVRSVKCLIIEYKLEPSKRFNEFLRSYSHI